jgi:hypothetical protein
VDGRQVLVRDALASPEAALVRSHLVGAALVSNDELPGHVDGWFPVVPVKGVEDVLILCLNPAPLNTQESVSLQCVLGWLLSDRPA